MSSAAKPYTIPLNNVGLDYARNDLLISPFGLEDVRNCLLSGGIGNRGGTSILDNISGNPRITGGYDYSLKNGERFLVRSTEDGKIYKTSSNTIRTGLATRYPESLGDVGFAVPDWGVTGDFNVGGGNAAYTHSSGVGTLTQTKANHAVKLRASALYELTYPVSGSSGDAAATIPNTVATVEKTLVISDGTQTIQFFTIADPTDFIINATSTSGGFTLDDVSLKELGGAARSVKFSTYKEELVYTNGINLVETWDGSAAETQPFGGVRADDIAFSEIGRIAYLGNPTANDTVTLHGIVFTYVAAGAAGNQINIKASLLLTLDETVIVLNGSAETNVAKCTYIRSGGSALQITRDTATSNDPFQIEASITEGTTITGVYKVANIYFAANPGDGDTLNILGGGFTFKTTIIDNAGQIAIGATLPDTLDNIVAWFNDPDLGGGLITQASDNVISEDGANTLTFTAVDSTNGNVYDFGARLVGLQVTVSGTHLYGQIVSSSLDFYDKEFSNSTEIRVFNSSTSDGTYTTAGNTLFTSTGFLYLAFGTSLTPEAVGASISITYGMPTDWTDGNMPKYSMIYNVGNNEGILFYGVRTNPGRIYIVPNGSFDASNSNVIQLTIETENGLGIVGASEYGNRQFMFSRNNAWFLDLSSTDTSNWTFVKVPFSADAMHDGVIVPVGNDLHAASPDLNIYSIKRVQAFGDYEKGSLTKASVERPADIDRWIKANVDFDYFEDFHAEYDSELEAVFWWFVRSGQTTIDTALVYFVNRDKWCIHDNRDHPSGFSASCSFAYREAGGIKKLYTCDYSGNTWKLNQTSSNDNGNGYYAGFKFNKISYSAGQHSVIEDKHVDVNYIIQEILGSHTLDVNVWIDGVASELNTQLIACDARYKSFDVGKQGRDFQYEISNSNANEDFFIMMLVSMLQYNGIQPE